VMVMVALTVNLDWLKYFIQGNADRPDAYWAGLGIVPVVLFNHVLLGIYMNLSVWYKLTDQTRFAIYISGIGALMTIVLNLALIPQYSYAGAVASTTLVYLTMVGLSLFWGQKHYPIPYKLLKISTYSLSGLAVSLTSFFVFDSDFWIGNGMLLIFALFVLYRERDLAKRLFFHRG